VQNKNYRFLMMWQRVIGYDYVQFIKWFFLMDLKWI